MLRIISMKTAISANHGMGWGASLGRDGKASSFYMANVVVSILHRKDTLYDVCYKVIK